MTIVTQDARCRVCHRPLRNLVSIAQGVGPVCMKRVRQSLNEMLDRVRRGEAEPEYQDAYGASPEELQNLVERDVRNAYVERLRQPRRPSAQPIEVDIPSRTRGLESETTRVEWIDHERANVQSASGNTYSTTTQACNCPDFVYRRSRDPELAAEGCRHMEALRAARQEIDDRRRNRRIESMRVPDSVIETHEEIRTTFAQIDWTNEEEREQVLNTWKLNRPFEGTYISYDDEAWAALKQEATENDEYKYENVLGGTQNSFGIELEVEFDSDYQRSMAIQALYNEGILHSNRLGSYHSSAPPGMWRAERDGSLGHGGAEFVSPVLHDTPETWQQIERITNILKRNGAKVSSNCGGHVHVGIAPLDHRTYSWQRLARIGVAYEHTFYKMGAADLQRYRQSGETGRHRGSSYTKPLSRNLSFGGNTQPEVARSRIGNGTRYAMFNTQNIDRRNRPAIEMRYPNGSIDAKQIQAQIQVANAVVHQAAIIRNDTSLSQFTPKFSEVSKHLRYGEYHMPDKEEENFRKFLDVIGNREDRLAATKLWMSGRVY